MEMGRRDPSLICPRAPGPTEQALGKGLWVTDRPREPKAAAAQVFSTAGGSEPLGHPPPLPAPAPAQHQPASGDHRDLGGQLRLQVGVPACYKLAQPVLPARPPPPPLPILLTLMGSHWGPGGDGAGLDTCQPIHFFSSSSQGPHVIWAARLHGQ